MLWVTRKVTPAAAWDARSLSRVDSPSRQSTYAALPTHADSHERGSCKPSESGGEKSSPRQTLPGKRAGRRQRSMLLDGRDSCPSPPEECHYELLWNAHTGERRSPSPSKSETFTKTRGRKVAAMLARVSARAKRK